MVESKFVRLSPSTYKKLIKLRARLEREQNRVVSMNDVISFLLRRNR